MPRAADLTFAEITPDVLRELSGGDLRALHTTLNVAWDRSDNGQELPQGLNREEFVNRYAFLRAEMDRREIGLPMTALDRELEKLRPQESGKEMAGRIPHPLDREACERLLAALPDELVVREDFVRFGGPFLTEAEPKDRTVKVYLHDGFKDSSRDLKLHRMVRAATNCETEWALCPDGYPPDLDLVEGYDLVLRKCRNGFDLNVIDEPEFQERVYGSVEPPTEGAETVQLQERRQALADALVDFVAIPAFVCVTGSYIYHQPERKPNDIDIVVKSFDEREDIREMLEKPIREATGLEPQFVWEPRGPNWTFGRAFDLVCRVRRAREAFSGGHAHPHPPDGGEHDHPGLPPQTGQHGHGEETVDGAHRHRPGDPLEGEHLHQPSDLGTHAHPKALARGRFVASFDWNWPDSLTEPSAHELDELHEGIRPAFGSPGGKKLLAAQIVQVLPDHDKYVEPFAGGAAVFFAKKPSPREALNDLDGDISHAYRFIQNMTEADVTDLEARPNHFSRRQFFKLRDSPRPQGARDRFYRFIYTNAMSFGRDRTSTVLTADGLSSANALKQRYRRLFERVKPRLERVMISNSDFREVIRRHDGRSTCFYLDPPYPTQQGSQKTRLTNEDIVQAVKKIRGRFILSLPNDKATRHAFKAFYRRRVAVRRTFENRGEHGWHEDSELLISNFPLKTSRVWLAEAILQEAVKPGRFFLPQKPAFGFREPDGRDEAWDEFVKPALEAGHRVGVDVKRDGIRLVLSKSDDDVKIFTEKKGLERSKFLPQLTEAIRKLPVDQVILDAEVELWEDGKPGIRREFAPKLAVQTREPVTGDIRAFVFDAVFDEGDDLTDDDYRVRRGVIKRVLPKRAGPLIPLPLTEIKTRAEFDKAVEKAEAEPGSEGAMIKLLTGPDSKYAIETARSTGMAKLKVVSSVSGLVIGRRKQPAPFAQVGLKEPTQPVSGRGALGLFRRLTKPEKTFVYRVAIRNDETELQAINARQKYTPDDLNLRWVPAGAIDPLTKRMTTRERGEWRGTDDPAIWEMAKGWPDAKEGEYQYGKTFAVKLNKVRPGKDLAEVEVSELQEWKDDEGKVRWSWTFPTPVAVVLEQDRPADAIRALRKTTRFISEIEGSVALAEKYDGRAGPTVKALMKARMRLSPEERDIVMKAKAVWHHGPHGEETPAVWKSVVNGRTWYACNTYRALNVMPTLKGAIRRFHDFIKGTA